MASLLAWLRTARPHTASLAIGITLLGYFLAGGSFLSWGTLLFFIFGLVHHSIGFLDNGVQDYIRGYDSNDPHKQHFPLVTGEIKAPAANRVVWAGIILGAIYGSAIARFQVLPMVLILLMIVTGLIYNRGAKRSLLSPIPIAIAFSLLIPFAYFGGLAFLGTNAVHPSIFLILIFTYFVCQFLFQIGVEGYLKDLKADPKNLLVRLGLKFDGESFTPGPGTVSLSALIRLVMIGVGTYALYLIFSSHNLLSIIAVIGFAFEALLSNMLCYQLVRKQKYDNAQTIRRAALIETTSFEGGCFMLLALIGWEPVAFLIPFAILYFIIMNRLLWGTVLRPRV